jgi:hemerythrin
VELRTLFSFLEEYVVKHFGNEGAVYAGLCHVRLCVPSITNRSHAAFIRDLREFKIDLEGTDPGALFIEEFKRWMHNWWMMHIEHVDKGLGRFLQSAFPLLGRKQPL